MMTLGRVQTFFEHCTVPASQWPETLEKAGYVLHGRVHNEPTPTDGSRINLTGRIILYHDGAQCRLGRPCGGGEGMVSRLLRQFDPRFAAADVTPPPLPVTATAGGGEAAAGTDGNAAAAGAVGAAQVGGVEAASAPGGSDAFCDAAGCQCLGASATATATAGGRVGACRRSGVCCWSSHPCTAPAWGCTCRRSGVCC